MIEGDLYEKVAFGPLAAVAGMGLRAAVNLIG